MFNKQNFCHVASNNRNEQKAGIFVYKTTDDLQTVLQSGYFNEKIIDINLHDLIIHEQTNATDKTIVERNLLCVVERTLENVGTQLIQSNWEKTTEQTIADIETEIESLDNKFVLKAGDTMTGSLCFREYGSIGSTFGTQGTGVVFAHKSGNFWISDIYVTTAGVIPAGPNKNMDLGRANAKWITTYTTKLNNGGNLEVPAVSGTLATKADVDLAANSGDQLTNKGVWYAKMYAATVAPSAEDGTNYADFSQTDGQGNPIIVLYERQNGAWVQTDTITPPAEYNGYVTVTSKIWDIVEQDGQQGGKVLWAHNTKTFTPYPQIISFEDAALTGNSTVQMPAQPTGNSIVNVDYLSTHSGGTGKNVGDIFFTTRTDNGLAGAVECNGATYNTTDFVGSGNIGGLLADGKVPYVSLADYATALAADGVCGVYGWDGAGTTAFRVPSLTDIFVETGTAAQIGDYLPAGLPDHSHTVTAFARYNQTNDGSNNAPRVLGPDVLTTSLASASNSIYGNSNTVQPNTVRYRAMVQLATGATDEALETCTSVLADVAGLKSHEVIEFQAPTADNNYVWYRKYADGWVEMGGRIDVAAFSLGSGSTLNVGNVTFPVVVPFVADISFGNNMAFFNVHVRNYTTTNMDVYVSNQLGVSYNQGNCYVFWKVAGMYA